MLTPRGSGGEIATIETSRLLLRPWCDADLEPWAALNADPRVMEFFPALYDRARSDASAAKMRELLRTAGYGWWPVEVKGGARFAGVIQLQEVPFEAPFTPALEVGWRFAVDAWGYGYATEGARAALAYAFDRLERGEVIAITAQLNLRSQRVMERLGMTRDARDDFEHPWLEPGHRLRPHVLYRMTRERFAQTVARSD